MDAPFISADTDFEPSLNFRDIIVIYLKNVLQAFGTTKSYNKGLCKSLSPKRILTFFPLDARI